MDCEDFMTPTERLLDRLGYEYAGLDEFEGDPVYTKKHTLDEYENTKSNQTYKEYVNYGKHCILIKDTENILSI